MRRWGVAGAVAAVVLVASCATVRVRHDYDPSARFPEFKTFAIKPGTVSSEYPLLNSPLLAQRVTKAISNELSRRGLREVAEQPDLVATWNAGARNYVTAPDPWGWGWGWGWGGWGWGPGYGPYWGAGWGWGPGYPGYWGYQYTEGTLVVDLVDAKTNQVVWRGYAQSSFDPDELGGHKGDEKVAKVVGKIFEHFPPAGATARSS